MVFGSFTPRPSKCSRQVPACDDEGKAFLSISGSHTVGAIFICRTHKKSKSEIMQGARWIPIPAAFPRKRVKATKCLLVPAPKESTEKLQTFPTTSQGSPPTPLPLAVKPSGSSGGGEKKNKKKSEPFAKRPNPGFLNPISFRSGLQPED